MRMLRPKNINRLCVALALIAPLVYLFGTQFMALAGAHGEDVLADTMEVTPSYDDLMDGDDFNYSAFDWTNEHGTRLGFSLGFLYLEDFYNDWVLYGWPLGVEFHYDASMASYGLGFSGESLENDGKYIGIYFDSNDYLTVNLDDTTYEGDGYFCFYVVASNEVFVCNVHIYEDMPYTISYYYYDSIEVEWTPMGDFDIGYSDCRFYFDDGAHLPEGVEWNDELRSYFVPQVKAVESTSYRDALFGNMFGSRNFLTKIGENAIGSSPLGFAPFGAFLGYIDTNMLHLGNTPLGLMGYGYVYWCSHVLLFDLLVYFLVFFIRLIKSIVDRWEVSR